MGETSSRTRLFTDFRELAVELIEYREILFRMTERDLRLRYKQTAMGFGWAVFTPLLNMAIFTVIFTRVARVETEVPYPIYAFCGLLAWNFLATSLTFSANSLTSNISLVTKVYFPREVYPLSSVLACFVDFMVGAILLVLLMAYYGTGLHLSMLFLPVILAVQLVFTAAAALALAMTNLFYRDVKYLFQAVLAVWMYASSVVYPVDALGGRLAQILQFNPMTQIIEAYRDVLLFGRMPPALPFALTTGGSLLLLALCWLVFHRAEFQFAENV